MFFEDKNAFGSLKFHGKFSKHKIWKQKFLILITLLSCNRSYIFKTFWTKLATRPDNHFEQFWYSRTFLKKFLKVENRAKKFFTSVGESLQVRSMQLISTHLSESRIDGNFLDRSSRSTPTHSRADWNFTFEGCFSPIKCVGGSLEITWIAQNDPHDVLLMGQQLLIPQKASYAKEVPPTHFQNI